MEWAGGDPRFLNYFYVLVLGTWMGFLVTVSCDTRLAANSGKGRETVTKFSYNKNNEKIENTDDLVLGCHIE